VKKTNAMRQSPAPADQTTVRDDRIFRETKWLAFLILPFLIGGFFLLYIRPSASSVLFAWTIRSPMTAMMLASAYAGGIYYFTGVARATRWHHVKVGMLPVTAFASILGIATVLHWDLFHHLTLWFAAWAGLYFTAPFAVAATWMRNRVTDPGTPDPADLVIPAIGRGVVAIVGVIALPVSLLLLLRPEAMIANWPWPLTPLDARVTAAMFALPAVVGLGIAMDARWSSARLILQAQAFSLFLILVGVARAWDEFTPASPLTYLFVGGLGFLFVGIISTYLLMETRRARLS